jgi:autotransporter-associated beta strand protein
MRTQSIVRACVVGLLSLGIGAFASDDVVINEAQSSNGLTLADGDGDYSDWIELLNRGTASVDLAGWCLSDRPDTPLKWVFPHRLLGPGQRLLVFASGKDRTNAVEAALIESPQAVPGLVFWAQADAETYTNGAKVSVWTDLSGLGNHATQTVATAQPVFVTNAVNGRAAVRFTRSSAQQLFLPVASFSGLTSLRDLSVFIVCRWGGQVTSGLCGAWGSSNNSHFEINSGGQVRFRVASLNSVYANGAMSANAWCQVEGLLNGAGDTPVAHVYRDGVLKGSLSADPGSALLSTYTTMGIGNSDSNTRFFDGYMAEVLFFNRALQTVEREAVERYLAARYGLPFQGGEAVPELHTNFSLDADGETVVLTRPDAATADRVEVPEVPEDASYGRVPDGTGAFAYLATPTPGAVNAGVGYTAPQKKPDFSRRRGSCDAPFELTITPDDPAALVYYTLDGSEPSVAGGTLYTAPVAVTNTTVVRALAFLEGALPQRAIATHTYLFLDGVLAQTARPEGYPADWNGFTYTSYAISPQVAAQPGYAEALRAALRALPVLSLAAPVDELFGAGGVYANPTVDGLERAVSAEWLTNGVSYTQADAGLRVQGGASRQFSNTPKKSLRLLFKEAYGDGRLKKPVLAEGGGTPLADFNTLILRADYNNSWVHWDAAQRLRGTSARDQWVRDTQIAMSGSGSHGNHVHLFLNGLYWGVYNVSERPDAAFGANYFGGSCDDYDAMTHDGIRDGDNVAWNAMLAVARSGLASQAQYEAVRGYLDVTHFADYMIANIYGSNWDWPHNNWNAIRRREPGAGYLFFCWDAERTLEGATDNRVSLSGTGNPAELYAALRQNAEFRLLFADRLRRHCFHGGALTPERAAARFAERAGSVAAAVFGEAARWGAYRNEIYDRGGPSPVYGLAHWSNECARLADSYFPSRTVTVVAQFRAAGLYPTTDAPELSRHGGTLEVGEALTFTNAPGAIYVTFDGGDPRVAYAGEAASNAVAYAGPFALTNACVVKARAWTNGVWSALTEAAFGVAVSEPHFLPAGDGDWGVASNWFGSVVPMGAGQRAHLPGTTADRNVNLRAPLTVGAIAFDQGASGFRNRVRDRGDGNVLTFDGGGPTNARVTVTGDGAGYAEFEVAAGVTLASTLTLDVRNLAGHAEYGALRLRAGWSGPGGLLKTGPGVATLTGDDKRFTGEVAVEEGVLGVTESAAPQQAAGVRVAPGGQVRLTSSSAAGTPRLYRFGWTLALSGYGRGAEVSDGAGQGKLGALRYDPGTPSNVCAVVTPVALAGEAGIHVDGSQNRLELAGGVSGGSRLVKSGGGMLVLPVGVALTAAVEVANGTLGFAGDGAVGALAGPGAVRVDGQRVRAAAAAGVALEAVLRQAGDDAAPNGALLLPQAPAGLAALRVYLPETGARFRGALFAPLAADLAAAVRAAAREVYAPDPAGAHAFDGVRWSAVTNAQVVTVPAAVDFGAGAVTGRVVEVRLGVPPASFVAWREAAFTNEAGRADEAVSGALAEPLGDGVPNLTRYALGLGWDTPAAERFPRLVLDAEGGANYLFPFELWRDDTAYVVDATNDLEDWGSAERLFDSRLDYPGSLADGWLSLREASCGSRRFYRLRMILLSDD